MSPKVTTDESDNDRKRRHDATQNATIPHAPQAIE